MTHVVVLTYFHLIRLWRATRPDSQIVKRFGFDLTCDDIGDPEVNNAIVVLIIFNLTSARIATAFYVDAVVC